jgi:hypothetical protein
VAVAVVQATFHPMVEELVAVVAVVRAEILRQAAQMVLVTQAVAAVARAVTERLVELFCVIPTHFLLPRQQLEALQLQLRMDTDIMILLALELLSSNGTFCTN